MAHLVYEKVLRAYGRGRWAPQMARLVYGTVPLVYEKVLRAYGTVLRGHHGMVLHRAVVSVPRCLMPGPAPSRSSDRSWQLHRGALNRSSNRSWQLHQGAPSRSSDRSWQLRRGALNRSSGKAALLGYAPLSLRCPFP